MRPLKLQFEMEGHHNGSLSENDIVISGMSALMPACHNLMEFSEKLYKKENLVTSENTRWKSNYPELPKYYGIVPGMDQFDAQFFMINRVLSHSTDAMTRKLMEHSYQAIFDAGICHMELAGRKIGVYVAAGMSETEKGIAFSERYHGILGTNRAMYANRISYYLDLKGPSMFLDANTSGSLLALEKAYQDILSGQCEAAIVGGARILLHPQFPLHYSKLVPSSPDGKTKCYDMKADGHSLSETINVIFLQKYKDAKRVYASVQHVKARYIAPIENLSHETFISCREHAVLSGFLREFYEEAKVSPGLVEYIEGCGAALPDIDKNELQAIEEVFCKDRVNPLLVGSVVSNVGFMDAAAGTAGIIKVLLAYQKGKLAGNINCDNPRDDIEALRDGRMRILTDHHTMTRTYAAVNSVSVTGITGHVLLQGYCKPKDLSRYRSSIPQLVTVSGRQESSVQKILDDIKGRTLDPEEIGLLLNVHKMKIRKHMARGYGIYTSNDKKAVSLCEKVDHFDETKRPLWFVYSGMGSQWAGMGTELMRIPVFAAAIERCQTVLQPKGIDLIHIITSPDQKIFDNILNSFVGIAAIQIGLTDVLKAVGLVPDYIIGHSVGELGCGYADSSLSAEEMILMAYSRGLVSIQTQFIRGAMAAVGVGYKQISKMIPQEIEVACHNGPDSSTISGPADVIKEFISSLTSKGIFAKEVPCSNIAYHSRYISAAGPGLLKYLKEVIKTPKLRSERWLSTSVPQDRWNESETKYSSAEYHTNNLLSPVLFEETSRLISQNAVLVEVAPHGLLQAILKRSLSENCHHIPLTRRGHDDNALFLLEALGKLYTEGYDVDVSILYPKIEFPVSIETRSLSHLIEWAYLEKLSLCQYTNVERRNHAIYKPIVTLHDEEYRFLTGHVIQDQKVFPFAGALVLVWDTLAMTIGQLRNQLSVKFKDVTLHMQPTIHFQSCLYLTVSLHRGSGRFEVGTDDEIIADGFVSAITNFVDIPSNTTNGDVQAMDLNQEDIYKLLFERGYQYRGAFRSIHSSSMSFDNALINWQDNWVTLIDGLLQMDILRQNYNGISQPKYIKRLCIDVVEHVGSQSMVTERNGLIEAKYNKIYNKTRCGGLLLEDVIVKNIPTTLRHKANLKELTLFPFKQTNNGNMLTSLYVFIQIVVENLSKDYVNVVYITNSDVPNYFDEISHLLETPPKIKINIIEIDKEDVLSAEQKIGTPDLIFVHDFLSDKKVFEALYHALPNDVFIMSLGVETESLFPSALYSRICSIGNGRNRFELARWKPLKSKQTTSTVTVRNNSDLAFLCSTRSELPSRAKLVILSSYPPVPGLKELVKKWRSEKERSQVYVAMINHKFCQSCQDDDLENFPTFDLTFNVLDHGTCGGEYYIPLREEVANRTDVTLKCSQIGDLNSFEWVQSSPIYTLSNSGIPIEVHFAGLNVYDAKVASGEVSILKSSDQTFGMDFSGLTSNGTRVMGLISGGAVSNKVIADTNLLWPVPDHWTLEEAATVPLPYSLAFYCLAIKCRLIRGMNILIHGGAGALGQAAISIALANGCDVFTTVRDERKKAFLCKMFPELPAHHIGNSRDVSFHDMVMNATNGEGCHIIISSVNRDLKQATLNCCATSGTTIDVVQIHTNENYVYGMFSMTKSRSYLPIDFASVFNTGNQEDMKKLQLLISSGIARGYVRPLSRVSFTMDQVPRAFKLLACSGHRGRVLLNLIDSPPEAQPRLICSPKSCQLIICDTDDFAVQLADRLINNGAKKLYLLCSKVSAYLEMKERSWKKFGIQIYISENSGKIDNIETLLKDANRLGPVEGIFVVATDEKANKYRDQITGMVNDLDLASREICSSLRYFTVISADSFIIQEISIERARFGLPSTFIQIHNLEKFKEIQPVNLEGDNNTEVLALKRSNAIDAIERAILSKKPVTLAYATPEKKFKILDQVSDILGVNLDKVPQNTTLKQVGIDQGKTQELVDLLEANFNIKVSKDILPEVTVKKLKRLQGSLENRQEQDLTGLGAYFKDIIGDELLANLDLVLMLTLIHKGEMRPDEFDSTLTYLCIIPGLEGHFNRFKSLCQRLKIPAVVVQPGYDILDETIEDMALRLVNVMIKKLKIGKHFYLLGYEFGIYVAFEMASILESLGYTGTVYCLGGNPQEIHFTMAAEVRRRPEEVLQNNIILHFNNLITGTNSKTLLNVIKRSNNWKEKVNMFMEELHGRVSYTMQYNRALIESAYSRLMLILKYNPKHKQLKSKIVVIRAKLPTNPIAYISNDWKELIVHQLQYSLENCPNDLNCSDIVNKYLEADILNHFKESNRCETYLINDGSMFLFSLVKD